MADTFLSSCLYPLPSFSYTPFILFLISSSFSILSTC
ncbi:uncharacterized protein [Blastocystis hominis]|uniref:Uncharacterized protein n=1 Tax=Blastocystis hominis TaxID=12968 RepID=D8M3I2_BLAHO|nr:uncharacterized protein [Blastocystis hominis]CBK22455.2 unnamed protein product [Blastocystis hominis]|eukprot:XP_012896503.1 uncharacterized protein [Blastocystis hominis]